MCKDFVRGKAYIKENKDKVGKHWESMRLRQETKLIPSEGEGKKIEWRRLRLLCSVKKVWQSHQDSLIQHWSTKDSLVSQE